MFAAIHVGVRALSSIADFINLVCTFVANLAATYLVLLQLN